MLSNETPLRTEYERLSGASYGRCQCRPPQRKPVSPMMTSDTTGSSNRHFSFCENERGVSWTSRPSSPNAVSCSIRLRDGATVHGLGPPPSPPPLLVPSPPPSTSITRGATDVGCERHEKVRSGAVACKLAGSEQAKTNDG